MKKHQNWKFCIFCQTYVSRSNYSRHIKLRHTICKECGMVVDARWGHKHNDSSCNLEIYEIASNINSATGFMFVNVPMYIPVVHVHPTVQCDDVRTSTQHCEDDSSQSDHVKPDCSVMHLLNVAIVRRLHCWT